MSDYRRKLRHNYHELTRLEKLRYRLWDSYFMPREQRYFFEGCKSLLGQMYIADRKGLFDTIVANQPRHCFEIGTWWGAAAPIFWRPRLPNFGAEG
jgi:hypothetical protein